MSEIRANTISDAAGTGPATLTGQYAAKAWVNFDGTGTVAIRESGNVSSITDNGTGDYTANFTNSMANGNYAVTHGGGDAAGVTSVPQVYLRSSSASNQVIQVYAYSGSFLSDSPLLTFAFYGDLA